MRPIHFDTLGQPTCAHRNLCGPHVIVPPKTLSPPPTHPIESPPQSAAISSPSHSSRRAPSATLVSGPSAPPRARWGATPAAAPVLAAAATVLAAAATVPASVVVVRAAVGVAVPAPAATAVVPILPRCRSRRPRSRRPRARTGASPAALRVVGHLGKAFDRALGSSSTCLYRLNMDKTWIDDNARYYALVKSV
ncbi:lysine-rich arabinogalactan protein 18-like [Miscanthus floridulus]|uniref:lysine-rich arabinogalactan protein 18-like n=1 Tax=Miscanthus floridulus TaxID=154761 RepID=UPI00345B4B3F